MTLAVSGTTGVSLVTDGSISFAKLLGTDWANAQTASGYQKLPSGILIQWGTTAALVTNTDNTITYPTAFTSGAFVILMTRTTALGVNESFGFAANPLTTTTFNARQFSSAATAAAFRWVAIGV